MPRRTLALGTAALLLVLDAGVVGQEQPVQEQPARVIEDRWPPATSGTIFPDVPAGKHPISGMAMARRVPSGRPRGRQSP